MNNISNNKRIAQNSALLYIRMLLIMSVTLYTSRVILQTLGIEDYGIYGVVGGIVTMLGFVNASLSTAGTRFITFTLGKGDAKELELVFSTVLLIHVVMMVLIVVLGETVGLWFVCHKLVIPPNRLTAALWVYHCSIFATAISVISVPYNSLIIAYERMRAFAYISILEAILKLVIVWLLVLIPVDKLIVYGVLSLVVQFIIRFIYTRYCKLNFVESKFRFSVNYSLVKQISSYAGWTLNGSLAVMGYTQGINILLNLFFNPAVNAARAIAVQVQAAIMTFIQNFQMAIKPQMIKSYASKDLTYMHTLIVASSKYGFYLMLLIVLPLMLCISPILKLWLGIVPEHTNSFVYIILVLSILNPLASSLIIAIHATGKIRKFQIYEGTSLLMVVPIAYLLLKFFHITPEEVMLVYLYVEIFTFCIRIWIVLPQVSMSYIYYLKKVILPILFPFVCFLVPSFYCSAPIEADIWELLLWVILSIIYMFICIMIVGLNLSERSIAFSFIRKLRNNIIGKWKFL